jgi:hypothetical protein
MLILFRVTVEQSWGCSNVTLNTRAADLAPRVEGKSI